ncbi:hypothetical protein F5972_08390 [Microbispora cellulosiformans]|uniref:DOD-type homing endonuclease domain-containing protein n=1 Tax=Microbispora cellulosiformans TaxID=2614688 RepID=A0A5J5K4Y7_9ACTN|nr:LAGLIDADG family homing endonuclease [Microbispora cellulosiformans]KAA9379661.1 hypothetical protein F5972_08390 [Microbispora cellulosiformans]
MTGGLDHLDDEAALAELLAAQEALRKDILRDPVTLARALDPTWHMRPHLRVIGDAMAGLEAGEYDRLLVITPPQVGKSTSVAEWGPYWWLCLHARDNVAITSYSDDLALRRGKAVKAYIEEYGEEFGLVLRPGSGASHDYNLRTGGGVRSVSVGSGLTGFSVNFLVIDDPHKDRKDAESVRSRQRVHDWYSSTALKRLQPDRNAVVIILTRWHCLVENQRVSTVLGDKPVSDIQPGELVLTSDGYQPVVATAARLHNGETLTLAFYGSPETLQVTPEHRVWTEHGWREARQVQRLDWLLLPARRRPEMTAEELAALLPSPPAPRRDPARSTRVRNAPLTREEMEVHLAAGMTYQQIAERYGSKTRSAAYEWARVLGVTRPAGNVIDLACVHDPEFWRVVGYWVAEGTLTYGRDKDRLNVCRWSFGEHERDTHAAHVREVLGRHGLRAAVNLRGDPEQSPWANASQRTAVVTVSSAQLANLLKQFGLGATKKQLPDWAHRLPREHALALIDGWTLGDGCEYRSSGNRDGWKRVTSSSFRLLRDMQTLLAQHGIAASIMRSGGGAPHELRYHPGGGNRHIRADDSGLWVRVKSIEATHYEGPVYDLQTPTGDFVAGGVLVHNCDDLAGRRLAEEGRLDEGGRWKVLHLPAIADPKFGPDPLGRAPGEPLPHPKIRTRDRAALLAWWSDMKRTSIVRDWHALGQGDPKPVEGALVSAELLRTIRANPAGVQPQRVAVAVDPSGGGRDTAGVIGGFLGDDQRVWITHDRSGVMSSTEWSMEACLLVHETGASVIFVENNYGGDMCELAIATSWDALQREGRIPARELPPMVQALRARQGKLLRAEPIAQQMKLDRVRLAGAFHDLEAEWSTWMPTDPDSPGRIDASVYLAFGLLPDITGGAIVHAPLPNRPTPQGPSAAGVYGRNIGDRRR